MLPVGKSLKWRLPALGIGFQNCSLVGGDAYLVTGDTIALDLKNLEPV